MNQQKNEQPKDQINRDGARRYDAGVRANVRSGASQEQARDAERALDGRDADKLREAEQEGKEPARRQRS